MMSNLQHVSTHIIGFFCPSFRKNEYSSGMNSSSWMPRTMLFSYCELCKWTILCISIHYAIGKLVDNRLNINKICSVGKTEIYFLIHEPTSSICSYGAIDDVCSCLTFVLRIKKIRLADYIFKRIGALNFRMRNNHIFPWLTSIFGCKLRSIAAIFFCCLFLH